MISLSYALENLGNYLQITLAELDNLTVKELQQIAKILGVPSISKLRKTELVEKCWAELENIRAQLAPHETPAPYKEAVGRFKVAHKKYTIELGRLAEDIYKRIQEIGKKGRDLQAMKDALNGLVASVAHSESVKYEFSTIKSRRTELKKKLDGFLKTENPLFRETYEALVDYFYSQMLSYQRDESVALNKSYKSRVSESNSDKKPVKIGALVGDCRKTLQELADGKEPHWTKVSIALALGTGRRMAEIHSLGQFEVTGEYEMYFSGQAKTRDADGAKTEFKIPTLFPASQLKAAINYLDAQGRRIPAEEQLQGRDATNKAFGMALSRAMVKYPVNYKGLRALYAECQWFLLPEKEKQRTEKHVKYSQWLGHINKEGASDATFMSYMVWQIMDFDSLD